MTPRTKRRLKLGSVTVAAVVLLGIVVLVAGVVPIAASSGHWAATEWILHFAMRRSIATSSLGVSAPDGLDDPALVMRGAGHYHQSCEVCHGKPGADMPAVAAAMMPPPPALPRRVGELSAEELFTVVKHGVKFTGMPAFPTQDRDDEVWAVVAFLLALPELDAAGYAELTEAPSSPAEGGEAARLAARRCGGCHGADGQGRLDGAFPKLAGQRETYLVQALAAYANGDRRSGIMGPVATSLSEAERRELAHYYAGRDPMGGGTGEPSARGKEIVTKGIADRLVASCEDCHGPSATPKSPTYPILAGQDRRYLTEQLQLFRDGRRGGGPDVDAMKEVATHELTDAEVAAVAAHYASATPPR